MTTDLSPAAQAVREAAEKQTDLDFRYASQIAAAALRAAAEELGPKRILEPGHIFSAPAEQWHYEFQLEAKRKLLAIATELEGWGYG